MSASLQDAAQAALDTLQRLRAGYVGIGMDPEIERVVDTLRVALAQPQHGASESAVQRARRLETLWAAGTETQTIVSVSEGRATFAAELAGLFTRVSATGEHPYYTRDTWAAVRPSTGASEADYWQWVAQHRMSMYRPAKGELLLLNGNGAELGTIHATCWVSAALSPAETQTAVRKALDADDYVAEKKRWWEPASTALEAFWLEDPDAPLSAIAPPAPDEAIETTEGLVVIERLWFREPPPLPRDAPRMA